MLSGQTDGRTPERVEPMRMDRTHLPHTLGPNLEPPPDPPARAGPGPRWPLLPSSLGFCMAVRPEALHRGRCSGRLCLTPGPSFPRGCCRHTRAQHGPAGLQSAVPGGEVRVKRWFSRCVLGTLTQVTTALTAVPSRGVRWALLVEAVLCVLVLHTALVFKFRRGV